MVTPSKRLPLCKNSMVREARFELAYGLTNRALNPASLTRLEYPRTNGAPAGIRTRVTGSRGQND